ncbi:RodZ domain-containing protein [Methyloradius palustris]|uniref:Membrane protein n=1 Tax=Methyloradius palustris TaxID=2778876 RepID=A0A8D5G3U5_9PROT|nr:RodZ domain-containing protein [Methyloradius palustris]BCM25260.1 membrane protein [Methyloradius palustris]
MTETATSAEQTESLAQTAPACGAVLKAAREQKKLSIEDISSRLRLSVHQIQALENDDFSVLPSAATMTRGFIRNYARLLEVDSEPLLLVYQAHASGQTNHSLTIKSANILITSTQKPVWKKYIVSSLVILLLIGLWVIYMDYFHVVAQQQPVSQPLAQAEDTTQGQVATDEPMPEPALPVAERDAAAEVVAPVETVPVEVNSADKSLPTPASNSATATEKPVETVTATSNQPAKPVSQLPTSVPAPVVNAPVLPISSQSQTSSTVPASAKPVLKVRFTFTEPTWVSVLDADNKEVLNKTGQPGGQEKIEVSPPAKLVIGNANGTLLEVNNKAIDLTPYNKLNVVRLTLE